MHSDPTHILQEYYKQKDPVLREKIVDSYSNLVSYIAKKLAYNRDDLPDLIQVGVIGLLKSIDRFEPSKETDFSTFATPNIIGEIKHYFRDKRSLVKIPRKIQETHAKVRAYLSECLQNNGQTPTIYQIARHLNLSEEAVLECMEAGQATQIVSLDATVFSASGQKSYEPASLTSDTMESSLNKEMLLQAMQCLRGKEGDVIQLRFYQGYTQNVIAKKLGISQMHVSRLLSKAIERLRKEMTRIQKLDD